MARRLGLSVHAFAVALWVAPGTSRADVTTDQCLDANTHAQWFRHDGKFVEAREQLTLCSNAHCPGMVRDDCVQRLDELERAQPTIVFDVKDPAGNDLSAVSVSVDGRALVDRLDGSALAVDAGAHTFTFVVGGQPPVTRSFVLKEGEKGRRENLVVGAIIPPPRPSSGSPAEAAATAAPSHGERRVLAYGAFGLGGAGVIVGSVFGIMALSDKSSLDRSCFMKKMCPQSDVDAINRNSTISTVGFGVGIAGLVAGVILVMTTPVENRPGVAETPSHPPLAPWVGKDVVGLVGTFR